MSILSTTRAVAVEFVGAAKISTRLSKLEALDKVGLVREQVASAGVLGHLAGRLDAVRTLDLACNLLTSFDDVAAIAAILPALVELGVADNRFDESRAHAGDAIPLPGLEILVVNRCRLGLAAVAQLAARHQMASLRELHMVESGLTTLDADLGGLGASLRLLDLSYNPLTWAGLAPALRALPHLSTLVLAHTDLDSLDPALGVLPPMLTSLSLAWSKVASPDVLIVLAGLGTLTHLRLHSTPLDALPLGDAALSVRVLVLALMPGLEVFNGGSRISNKERSQAERTFVKYADSLVACELRSAFLARAGELAAKHPDVIEEAAKAATLPPASMLPTAGSGRAGLTLVYGEATKSKRLKLSTQIAKLRTLIGRLFTVAVVDLEGLHLVYSHPSAPGVHYALDDSLVDLGFYNVEDGGVIELCEDAPIEQAYSIHSGALA
ncbi:tubulin-specific chaperone E, variant [Thecamonas trahens ATCC 50062]|nr:tubulin-specific chaperone E, variant [Thecamonas trahens ATCC 50062]KNC47017.1 tubulin-specific chaperone E, variant [Thecamonas trahens ATCC 50062]|eukprot:XP_013759798.1 tubulin-specific chaperone E, variant [Thecamonas trahens ATCC 50062]